MSTENDDIDWEENKNNSSIEWSEIRDNLKILKARKEDFIDLGNPFQSPKASFARSEMKLPPRASSSRKWVYGCIVALLLISALFYLRGAHLSSVIEITEAWEVSYTIDIDYTNDLKPIEYRILVNFRDNIPNPVKFSIDGKYKNEIVPENEEHILYNGKNLPREILFYEDSLFGKKIIDSLRISLPVFDLDIQNNQISIKNQTTHTFYVLSEKNYMVLLKSGEKKLLDVVPHQNILLSLIDFETGCVYNIRVWVRIDEH
jgi:hypothetical protein